MTVGLSALDFAVMSQSEGESFQFKACKRLYDKHVSG